MVEKAGHNKQLQRHRVDWINEGRPKSSAVDEGRDAETAEQQIGDSAPKQAARIAPIFDRPSSGRQKTPDLDDLFADEDGMYSATPVGVRKSGAAVESNGDEPDEDELDALMAMDQSAGPSDSTRPPGGVVTSLFGDGKPKAALRAQPERDEFDELDALMAEAEQEPPRPKAAQSTATPKNQPAKGGDAANGEEDDLDALMAEAEAQSTPAKPPQAAAPAPKPSAPSAPGFDDDEEAMAEMDGLW